MQIEKKENFTIISPDENSFTAFYDAFLIEEKKRPKENIIIRISKNINITTEEFLLFLNIGIQKKENGTSFVIVNSAIDIDDFPESFNVTPTLQEAEDIIEMEAIERELGF
ncbi:hypothetical protein OAJ14_02650 [Polaribacter sp.]|nr:hypothetical protein [Polaribacter sp.]